MTYYWQSTWSRSKRHYDPFQDQEGMLSLRSCRVDSGRMLLFTVEQVFLPMGGFDWCLMQVHGTSKGVRGGRRPETFFMFKCSCLTIQYEFYTSSQENRSSVPNGSPYSHTLSGGSCVVLSSVLLFLSVLHEHRLENQAFAQWFLTQHNNPCWTPDSHFPKMWTPASFIYICL